MDKLSILAMALDAMEPGSKGYIDYKNKPGYQWRTINEAKVLLNGKGKIVSGAGGKFKGKTWGKKWKFKKKPKEGQQAGQNPLNAAAEALEEPTQNIENVPETAVNVPESVQTEKPEETVAGIKNEATQEHFDTCQKMLEESSELDDDDAYLAAWAFQKSYLNAEQQWDEDGVVHKDLDSIISDAEDYIKKAANGKGGEPYNEEQALEYLEAIKNNDKDALTHKGEQSPLEQAAEVAPEPDDKQALMDKMEAMHAASTNGYEKVAITQLWNYMNDGMSYDEALTKTKANLGNGEYGKALAEVEQKLGAGQSSEPKQFDESAFLKGIMQNGDDAHQYVAEALNDLVAGGMSMPDAIEKYDGIIKSETFKGALMDIEAQYHEQAGSAVAAENVSEFTPEPDYDKAKKATFDLFMNAEYGSMTEQIANDVNTYMKVDKKQYSEALESTLSNYDVTDPKVQDALKEINKAVTGEEHPYFENMALAQSPDTDDPNKATYELLDDFMKDDKYATDEEKEVADIIKGNMQELGYSFEEAMQYLEESDPQYKQAIKNIKEEYEEKVLGKTPAEEQDNPNAGFSNEKALKDITEMYFQSSGVEEDILLNFKTLMNNGASFESALQSVKDVYEGDEDAQHLINSLCDAVGYKQKPSYLEQAAEMAPEVAEEPEQEDISQKLLDMYIASDDEDEMDVLSLLKASVDKGKSLEEAFNESLSQLTYQPYIDKMNELKEKLLPKDSAKEPMSEEDAKKVLQSYAEVSSTGSLANEKALAETLLDHAKASGSLAQSIPYVDDMVKQEPEFAEAWEKLKKQIPLKNGESTNNQPSKESIEKALNDMYMGTDNGEESTILSDALAHYQNYGDLDAAFKYACEENSWIDNVESKADQTKKSFMNNFYPSAEPKAENSLANQPKVDAGEAQEAALSVYLHADSDSLEEKIADKLGDNLAANMSYEDSLKMLTDEYADSPEFMKAIYHVNEKVMEKVGPAGYDPPQYVEPPKAEKPKPKKPKVTKKQKLEAGKSQAEQMANQTNSINAKIAGQKYLEAMDENPKATANQLLKIAEQKIAEMPEPGTGGTSWKANLDKAKAYLKDIQDSVKNAGKNALAQAGAMMSSFPKQAYSAGAKAAAVKCHSMSESKQKFMGVFHKAWGKCSASERHAAWDYTGSYSKFNEPLRGIEYGTSQYKGVGNIDFDKIGVNYKGFKPGQMKKEIQDLTNAIDKSEYKENIHLRRGVDYDGMDKFFKLSKPINHYSVDELKGLLENQDFTEHGFMSCGAAEKTGFTHKDMELKVYAPAGSKMLYCPEFSQYDTENEMLLQRGTKFKVKNVSKVNGKLTIEMDIIGYDMQKV